MFMMNDVDNDVDSSIEGILLCPTCCVLLSQEPTRGCKDIEGCGLVREEIEENYDEDEEESDIEELCFE